MSLDRLVNRIMIIALLCVFAFVGGVWASIDYVRQGLNAQARDASIQQVDQRVAGLHAHTRLMAKDYNNWQGVHAAAMRGDLGYIADNYGITALNGDIFDRATMFDGPFETPIAWVVGGSRQPQEPQLPATLATAIRKGVGALVLGDRPTLDYMTLEKGGLVFHSASRLLPDTPIAFSQVKLEETPIAVISRALRSEELAAIESDLDLTNLRLTLARPVDQAFVPLQGLGQEPAAFLTWVPPRNGDHLIATVAPILGAILSTVLILALVGVLLLRRHAKTLVEREAEAARLARTDVLTGLPNRLAFMEHLEEAVSRADRLVAVVVIDLDGFKNVNDLVGHAGGDAVISQYAARLIEVRTPNRFVARIGGDEFVVVVTDAVDATQAARKTAMDIIVAADLNFNYNARHFELAASYGVASRLTVDETGEALLHRADRAMYHAKGQPGSQVSVWQPDMDRLRDEERRVGRLLRSALQDNDELFVVYQPIVDAISGDLSRVEALARWHAPELGDISPAIFIPIAEQSGLIARLGDLVLTKVCIVARQHPHLLICVNLSPSQLLADDFVDRTMTILEAHQVMPVQIELELTEEIAIKDLEVVGRQLQLLRTYGFSTALDDFGTGYASIAYLRQMPFDTLKIDRSLVSGMSPAEIADVVGPMVQLGHSLGKRVTAEGVETQEEAASLRQAGCDNLQGYHYGRPQAIENLMADWPELTTLAAE